MAWLHIKNILSFFLFRPLVYSVVTSLQKYWRGYHCRNLLIIRRSKGRNLTKNGGIPLPPGQLYEYIKWYRIQIPRYLRYMYLAMKKRMLHTWYNHAVESRDKFQFLCNCRNIQRGLRQFQR